MRFALLAPLACLTVQLSIAQAADGPDSDSASAEKFPGAAEPLSPPEWYGAGVRPSDPRTPEEERAGFHLPPGFEVRLFAAEPEIAKPMNMAFDARGRMWVTDSFEYPYPAAAGEAPRDSVRILEDSDGDGRADSAHVFADHLNIPIGVLPYGEGCLCYSIPNILYLRDTDGDGVCDQRDKVLGPFDTTRDTHGMVNSMRMGSDGWVYANHGFNNQSQVAGRDGHSITMVSGNTFRFRPDGSRVEHVTWGQVNPFGRAEDEWGYSYSADCHSKPISQLIRGGYYPSFGRPDDGLGFIPPMMDHLHGSTAISGLVYIPESLGVPMLEHQMLSGNVMTSRINRNHVIFHGATAKAIELPDFLTSDDPWFRPVDLQLGSDGNLYVADFYNRIIGHYEVPLEHPGRDRFRGRIWQIRVSGSEAAPETTNIAGLDAAALIDAWSAANPTRRRLALETAIGRDSEALDRAAERLALQGDRPLGRVTALWYLFRRSHLGEPVLRAAAADRSPIVRAQLQQVVSELARGPLSNSAPREVLKSIAVAGLDDENPHVVRAAAEATAALGAIDSVSVLLRTLVQTDEADSILRQTARIAIRDLLKSDGGDTLQTYASRLDDTDPAILAELASVSLALDTPAAGRFLVEYLRASTADELTLVDVPAIDLLRHAAQHVAIEDLSAVVSVAKALGHQGLGGEGLGGERALMDLITAELDGTRRMASPIRQWAEDMVQRDLNEVRAQAGQDRPLVIAWKDPQGNPWPGQTRLTAEGEQVPLTSSFPLGESYTGTLVSDPFPAPESLSFWLAGHNGLPQEPDTQRNRIELVDAASGLVLQTAFPPRSDVVRRVRWDCTSFTSRLVRIRCEDQDSGGAYAWIAFGGFDPQWIDPTEASDPLDRALHTIVEFRLTEFAEPLRTMASDPALDTTRRARAARTLARLRDDKVLEVLFAQLAEGPADEGLPTDWLAALDAAAPLDAAEAVALLARRLTSNGQNRFAERLAGTRDTLSLLLQTIEAGALSPQVLLEKPVWTGIEAVSTPDELALAERLLQQAQPTDEEAEQATLAVLRSLQGASSDLERGRALFTKHCAVCHQIGGVGQVVGPQLDGVGGRGAARLLEDILSPDRNVDRAFRTTTFITTDGRVLNGLIRSEDDSAVTVAGNDGKIFPIPLDEIDGRREGTKSLMPSNLHQTLTTAELAAVVDYLMRSTSTAP